MIWQQGGEVLDKANKKALFAGPQGVKALQLLTDMALKDKSLYPDQTPDTHEDVRPLRLGQDGDDRDRPVAAVGHPDHHVSYGVQVLPGFGGSHETISGPDVYMVFNHSDERRRAATEFMAWLHEPAQDVQWDHRQRQPAAQREDGRAARRTRRTPPSTRASTCSSRTSPTRTTSARPCRSTREISVAVGKAIATSLLGRGSPKDTLAQAAKTADKALG